MIHFNRESLNTALYWDGGIISHVSKPVLCYLVYLVVVVGLENALGNWDISINRSSLGMIMHFLVFLLVFRVNATQRNHQRSAFEVNHFFNKIETLIEICCSTINGPSLSDEPEVQRAHAEWTIIAKINIIRMCLALAVSFVFHCVLLTSLTEAQGEMNEESLQDLVFLRHRLQGLLYSKEMALVDRAICIVQEPHVENQPVDERRQQRGWCPCPSGWWARPTASCDGPQDIYRGGARKNRSMPRNRVLGMNLNMDNIPCQDEDDHIHSGNLPKVVMPMLMFAMKEAIGKPWGFSERSWSMFARNLRGLKYSISIIHTMGAGPTPLPYIQLSHLLVMIFAIVYPMTIDVNAGPCDTIVMPLLLYFTISAFDALAKMLESATGHDVTDLNFMEQIHNLEIHCRNAFNSTEQFGTELLDAMQFPMRSFNFHAAKGQLHPQPEYKHLSRKFNDYFTWVPMPTVILESLLQAHGHADSLLQILKVKAKVKLRKMIRVALRNGDLHSLLDGLTEEDRNDVQDAVGMIRKDGNLFSHYLAFSGVYGQRQMATPVNHTASEDHHRWKVHVGNILSEHTAGRLFGKDPIDSDRSSITTFRDVLSVLEEEEEEEADTHKTISPRPAETTQVEQEAQVEPVRSGPMVPPLLAPPPAPFGTGNPVGSIGAGPIGAGSMGTGPIGGSSPHPGYLMTPGWPSPNPAFLTGGQPQLQPQLLLPPNPWQALQVPMGVASPLPTAVPLAMAPGRPYASPHDLGDAYAKARAISASLTNLPSLQLPPVPPADCRNQAAPRASPRASLPDRGREAFASSRSRSKSFPPTVTALEMAPAQARQDPPEARSLRWGRTPAPEA